MSEDDEGVEFMALMERFASENEARVAEYKSVEREAALLTDQINTKADHLRQLSEQRNGLIVKCQSIRNAGQDAGMKLMTDWMAMMADAESKEARGV